MIQLELSESLLVLLLYLGVSHPVEHELRHAHFLRNLSFPHLRDLHVHNVLNVHDFHYRIEFQQSLN